MGVRMHLAISQELLKTNDIPQLNQTWFCCPHKKKKKRGIKYDSFKVKYGVSW